MVKRAGKAHGGSNLPEYLKPQMLPAILPVPQSAGAVARDLDDRRRRQQTDSCGMPVQPVSPASSGDDRGPGGSRHAALASDAFSQAIQSFDDVRLASMWKKRS